jgi:hypothetical protein
VTIDKVDTLVLDSKDEDSNGVKTTLQTSGKDAKTTLETSGEDAKLHSKRVEKIQN